MGKNNKGVNSISNVAKVAGVAAVTTSAIVSSVFSRTSTEMDQEEFKKIGNDAFAKHIPILAEGFGMDVNKVTGRVEAFSFEKPNNIFEITESYSEFNITFFSSVITKNFKFGNKGDKFYNYVVRTLAERMFIGRNTTSKDYDPSEDEEIQRSAKVFARNYLATHG